jgi:calcium-dependent protein kinase
MVFQLSSQSEIDSLA